MRSYHRLCRSPLDSSSSQASQVAYLDQPLKMPFHLSRQLFTRHEQAQLHDDSEGVQFYCYIILDSS